MRLPTRLISGSVRPDADSIRRFASLRWAALPIVDRRWTAPMSAIALGFGLFVGVAIGPGTQGSLGTTKPMIIQLPEPAPDTQTAVVPPETPPVDGGGGGGNAPKPPDVSGDGGGSSPITEPPPILGTPSPTPPVTSVPPITTAPPIVPITPTVPDTVQEVPEDESQTEPSETEEPVTVLTGTVVHHNRAAASYSIATRDGTLYAIHSHRPPGIGRAVEVETTSLANGTYAEAGKRRQAQREYRVGISGTVSFSDPLTGVYTVSAPGVSLLVRGGLRRDPPAVGETVDARARIADNPEQLPVSEPGAPGCGQAPEAPRPPSTALEQISVSTGREQATTTDVEAVVQGVCRDTRRLIVSADDVRQSGQDIVLGVPEAIRMAPLRPGQVLRMSVRIGSAGALTLSTIAGDEGKDGASDPKLVQP